MTYSMNTAIMNIPDISRLRINNAEVMVDDNMVNNQQPQPERNIEYLLQNPEHMINPIPLVQEHLNQQVNNIDSAFENINLNSTADIEQVSDDMNELNENRYNPLYAKIVPLEVANYYCREYFDDEDFVYMRFELPADLLEEIMESGNKTVTEYFDSYLNNVEIAEDDITGMNYFNMYNNCVKVYDTILEHYMPEWYEYDGPVDDDNTYAKFDTQWTYNCRVMLDLINEVLTLGMTDESMEYLCNYNKEVYTGLFIIMSRLKELFLHFNDKSSLSGFMDYNKDYRNITIRLVNNICVILLYLKFYYLNNSIENGERDMIYSDKMITVEEE